MKIYATKCKNCSFCIKSKTLSGMNYICSKTNKKVNRNYYCGNVPAITVDAEEDLKCE